MTKDIEHIKPQNDPSRMPEGIALQWLTESQLKEWIFYRIQEI